VGCKKLTSIKIRSDGKKGKSKCKKKITTLDIKVNGMIE
jgi:hypothetical protein